MLDPTPGILVHALRELPREACGVIDEYGEAVPLENVSKEPDRFAFSPEDQLMVWSWPIRAIYHSHVNVGPDGRHGWLGLPLLRARLADWRRIEAGEVGKGSLEKYRGELEGLDLIEVPESILRWMKEWTPKRWLTSRIEAAEKDLKMLTKVSESSRRSPGRSVNVAIHGLENDLGHLYFALWWKWLGEKHRSDRVERVAGRYGRGRGR
jgi:hypothetical protein